MLFFREQIFKNSEFRDVVRMSMIGGIDMLQAGEIKLIPMGLKDAEFIVNLRNKEEVFKNFFSNILLYDFGHNRWLNEINTTNNIFFIIEHKEKK